MKLINHVLDIRQAIQQAFDNRFSRMGLRADAPLPADQLNDDEHRLRRKKLDDIMQSHLAELGDYAKARQAAINECVFTLFNRIAAIKVMEAKELFPEIVRRRTENAGRSFEHNAWLEEHPEERGAEREGLKHFLQDQFDKLGEHIPLYRPDYPYSLMPTADELFDILGRFNAVDDDADCGEDTWKGDDILGWLYENFNAVEKEALKKSGEKTEYDKVSLQSQVYTPAWVVKFLVDNTLGKTYLEMFPDSSIKQKYKIANAPTNQVRPPKDLRELRLLDPACGSGNFLIYAFSLFYDLYLDQMENYGRDYSRRDIPKMIVEYNLFGTDIDERAAQISQIALFVKARVLGGHRSHWPKYTNVVSTHFFLPEYAKIKAAFAGFGSGSEAHAKAIEDVWTGLCSAYKFGSLVRVEERLNELMPNDVDHSLFKEFEMNSLFEFKNSVTTQLRNQVGQWSGEGSNPYTLAKTSEAMDFLQIISQSYDVVVANPPYTDGAAFGKELKAFVEANYKKPYKVNTNLYSCFIKRCCELAGDDGKVGMIHPHTFMYIKTFEDVRNFMLENTHINVMVDYGLDRVNLFGPGILLDATFYTLDMNKYDTTEGVYFNITANQQEKFKKESLAKAYDDLINGIPNDRVYTLPQSKLKDIESYPFIYWISDEFRKKFGEKSIGETIKVCSGISTGNNERFMRFWWEVNPNSISKDYKKDKLKWVRHAKGGPFNKWYGNDWIVLLWGSNGDLLKGYVDEKGNHKATIRNASYQLNSGITFCKAGTKGSSFRYLEENHTFDSMSPTLFDDISLFYTIGLVNSILCRYMLWCLNPTAGLQAGDVARVPFVRNTNSNSLIGKLSKQNINIKQYLCSFSLCEYRYAKSPLCVSLEANSSIKNFYNTENALLTQILLNESVINKTVFEVYELSEHDRQMVLEKEGIPVGDLPVSAEAKAAYREWLQGNDEFPASEEVVKHLESLEERTDLPRVTDFETLYQNNNGWEEFCKKHGLNPVEAWYQFRSAGVLPPQRTQELAFELIVDVVRSVLAKDDDGIIPLGDKMGEERMALRIEQEMVERGYSAAQFGQVCKLLGCPLEKFLQERFFQQLSDHLNLFMYLPKTPFIWHISSGGHHAIELFVSIYKWTRDTLFRIRSIYAANREAAIRDRLNSLDQSQAEGRIEAAELRAMLDELQQFCQKVDGLLASGYDPKLDDGVGKNIAPLQQRGLISYEVLNAGQLKKYLNADW